MFLTVFFNTSGYVFAPEKKYVHSNSLLKVGLISKVGQLVKDLLKSGTAYFPRILFGY